MKRTFRRRGNKRPKRPVHWVPQYWDADMSLNPADSNSLALCVVNDIDAGGSVIDVKYTLRRIVVELALSLRGIEVEEDLHAPYCFQLPWLLGVADAEDQDMENVKTAGLQSWLQSGRILRCGIFSWTYDNLVAGAFDRSGKHWANEVLHIDWKGGARMKPDDVLWLVFQEEDDGSLPTPGQVDIENHMRVTGYTRTLVSL